MRARLPMRGVTIALVLGMAAIAGGAAAETPGAPSQPKCLTAEINPVTGHVLCINPLGRAGRALAARGLSPLQAGRSARPVDLGSELHARASGNVSEATKAKRRTLPWMPFLRFED